MTNEDKILNLLTSMALSMEQIGSDIKRLDSKIDMVEKRIGERINDLESDIKDRFNEVDKRFDRVENEISNIKNRELHIIEMASKDRKTA